MKRFSPTSWRRVSQFDRSFHGSKSIRHVSVARKRLVGINPHEVAQIRHRNIRETGGWSPVVGRANENLCGREVVGKRRKMKPRLFPVNPLTAASFVDPVLHGKATPLVGPNAKCLTNLP